jgi:hypothetical protein
MTSSSRSTRSLSDSWWTSWPSPRPGGPGGSYIKATARRDRRQESDQASGGRQCFLRDYSANAGPTPSDAADTHPLSFSALAQDRRSHSGALDDVTASRPGQSGVRAERQPTACAAFPCNPTFGGTAMSSSAKHIRLLLAILTPAPIAISALFAAAPAGAAPATRPLPPRIVHPAAQTAVLPSDPRESSGFKKGGGLK